MAVARQIMRVPSLLFLGVLLLVPEGSAQEGDKPKPAPAAEMTEEIIVRGRRDGEPDFQTQYEHHKQEYERLRKIYGPETSPNRRLDRMTDSPNPDAGKSVMRSPSASPVQGRPSQPQ